MMVFVSNDQVIGYEMKGHSGYAVAGQDLVCAAVSILAQTGANALESLTGREPEVHMKDGYLQVMLPENLKEPEEEQAKIIFGTILVGLKDLVDVYPEYVELRYREV